MTAGIEDSTYITKPGSEDTHFRGDMYSGPRGHNNCMLVQHQVDLKGKFMAIRAPSISQSQRGSDTAIMAIQVLCHRVLQCEEMF